MVEEGRSVTSVQHLAQAHGQGLVAFAYVLTGDPETAEDLVQSTLLRMLALDMRSIDSPVAYARRVIVNLYLDDKRRQALFRKIITRLNSTARPDPEDSAEQVDERRALEQALRVLTPRERAAIVLRYYADQEDPTIAEYLGCSPATVRSLVHRGLPKLRTQLAAMNPDINAEDEVEDR